MKGHEICESCGERFPFNELTAFDGALLCEDCLDTATTFCSDCGTRIWREENAGTQDLPLCRSCYDHFYSVCSCCGNLFRRDTTVFTDSDDDIYCDECYRRASWSRGINSYYYKPTPCFYGSGSRFLGVELEIDDGGEDSDKADELMDIVNTDSELIYCKHDSSLHDGFEIVTHPMTLDFHQNTMPWKPLLRRAVQLNYRSHQSGTCGLHVHVNRDSFGRTEAEQDAAIARVLYFFEKHWEELLKFSRRTSRQLEEWASRYGYREQPREILNHAKHGSYNGRYSCVNLQNQDTIEFRIFRGTLKWNTLIATLQLVNMICDVAVVFSDEDIKAMSWTTFVSECRSPELIQYLKERRLYINEPVTTEEEV